VRKLARDTMTARGRIEATLRGELPDRVPVFDLIQHVPLIERITGGKVSTGNSLELLCRTIGECLDITRGIAQVGEAKKPVVGVLSALPVMRSLSPNPAQLYPS